MLDFERIDTGRLVLVHGPFTLRQLLQDAYVTFGGLAQEKGVQLVKAAMEESLATTVWVGDKWRLLQCLNNGVSNAVCARMRTPPGHGGQGHGRERLLMRDGLALACPHHPAASPASDHRRAHARSSSSPSAEGLSTSAAGWAAAWTRGCRTASRSCTLLS